MCKIESGHVSSSSYRSGSRANKTARLKGPLFYSQAAYCKGPERSRLLLSSTMICICSRSISILLTGLGFPRPNLSKSPCSQQTGKATAAIQPCVLAVSSVSQKASSICARSRKASCKGALAAAGRAVQWHERPPGRGGDNKRPLAPSPELHLISFAERDGFKHEERRLQSSGLPACIRQTRPCGTYLFLSKRKVKKRNKDKIISHWAGSISAPGGK